MEGGGGADQEKEVEKQGHRKRRGERKQRIRRNTTKQRVRIIGGKYLLRSLEFTLVRT